MVADASLVIPLALWSSSVPDHAISCVVVIPKRESSLRRSSTYTGAAKERPRQRERIATGSETGQVCIWEVVEDEVRPIIYTSGHDNAVSALLVIEFDHNQCVVSVSIDGTVCVWAVDDGLCLLSSETAFLKEFLPTSIAALGDRQHVLVTGRHKDIALVDLMKMKIVSVITGTPDWISGVYSCSAPIDANVALTLSGDVLRYWQISKNLNTTAVKTIVLDMPKVQCVSLGPTNTTIMAVNREAWSLFSVSNSHCIEKVPCPYKHGWVAGTYIDRHHVVVWTRSGKSALYRLPDLSRLRPFTFGEEMEKQEDLPDNPDSELKKVQLILEFAMPSTQAPDFGDSEKMRSARARHSSVLGCRYMGTCVNGLLCLSNDGGEVFVWRIPEDDLERPVPEGEMVGQKILAEATGTFQSGWSIPVGENDITDMLKVEGEDFSEVTASCLVVEEMLMVRGHSDGRISAHHIPTDHQPRYFDSGHSGIVTTLLCLGKKLLSGGRDGCIRLWELASGHLLFEWTVHCGTIQKLLPLEPYMANMRGKFLSISKDSSVGIFSLEALGQYKLFSGPQKPIVTVRLQNTQDYLFIVYEDRMVGVWELTSGQYEGSLDETSSASRSAIDLLALHDAPPNMHTELIGSTSFPNCAGPGSDCRIGARTHGPRVNVLLLNVKRVIQQLYQTAKSHKKAKIDSLLNETCPATTRPSHHRSATTGSRAQHEQPIFSPVKSASLRASQANALSFSEADDIGIALRKSTGSSPQKGECVDELFSSVAYQMYAYLLPWGLSEDIDEQAVHELHLESPYPKVSIGLQGHKGKMSFAIPAFMENSSYRWGCSQFGSSLHTLAAITFTKSLLQLGKHKNPLSNILTFFYAMLSEKVEHYEQPSLGFTTNFWQDDMEDILQSTQTIFFATLDAMSESDRKEFVATWAYRLRHNPLMRGMKTKSLAPIVLGILGGDRPAALADDLELQAAISKSLVELLFLDQTTVQVLAAECLGKGYGLWKKHIKNHQVIILKLFSLTMLQNESRLKYIPIALRQIGAEVPLEFVMALANPRASKFNPREHYAALGIIGQLVQKSAPALVPQLTTLVEAVLRSLDPKNPHNRESCLSAATDVLKVLISKYPMIAVENESNRLAVGCDMEISIFDLKTCGRSHVLKGHTSDIAAVTFSSDGKSMASYAIDEAAVRIWQTSTPLFGFGYPPRCVCVLPVSKLTHKVTPETILETIKLSWNAPKLLCLVRAGEGKLTFEL